MNQDEYRSAAEYWINKDADSISLEREELMKAIEDYINSNDTCALATGRGGFVRCTPIEYSYREGRFFLFTEGGLKFYALETNKNVCLAIFNKYEGFSKLKGMQVTGTAEIVEPFTEEYRKATEYKKIPVEALKKLAHPMNLICIIPSRIDFLNSDFKKQGYSSRQFIEFSYPVGM